MTRADILYFAEQLYANRVERGLEPEQPEWQLNELPDLYEPCLQVIPVFADGKTGDQLIYSILTGELIQEGNEPLC